MQPQTVYVHATMQSGFGELALASAADAKRYAC